MRLMKSEVGSRKSEVQFCNEEKFVGTVSVHKTSGDKDRATKLKAVLEARGFKANFLIKIFRSIFAAINLALISGGLVSCVVEVPQPVAPTEQQKPVLEPTQQPNQVKQKDKNDDDKHGDRKDDKNDDDKEDND
ncbi:MAG: hypothetical protein V7K58_05615 [Nostoc sp.]